MLLQREFVHFPRPFIGKPLYLRKTMIQLSWRSEKGTFTSEAYDTHNRVKKHRANADTLRLES